MKASTPIPSISIPYFNTTSSLFHPNWSIDNGVPALKWNWKLKHVIVSLIICNLKQNKWLSWISCDIIYDCSRFYSCKGGIIQEKHDYANNCGKEVRFRRIAVVIGLSFCTFNNGLKLKKSYNHLILNSDVGYHTMMFSLINLPGLSSPSVAYSLWTTLNSLNIQGNNRSMLITPVPMLIHLKQNFIVCHKYG